MFHDHGAAQRAALVAHHVFEDAELLGRQIDGFAGTGDFAPDAVERKVGHLQLLRSGLAAAQQSPHARQQFDEGEGLDQVIVGPLFQALDAILQAAAGAEDEDRRAERAVADLPQHLQSVDVGKPEIEDHHVVIRRLQMIQGLGAGEGGIHGVAGALEAAAQEVGDSLFVLHHQDSHLLSVYTLPLGQKAPRPGVDRANLSQYLQ